MMDRKLKPQNIPIQTPEGTRIRDAFFPKQKPMSVDWSALEIQILLRHMPEVLNHKPFKPPR